MENPNIAKVIKVGTSLAVIIPSAIRKELQIMRGDRLVYGIYDLNTMALRRLTDKELKELKPTQITF